MFQKNISEEKKKKTRNVDLTAFLVFFHVSLPLFSVRMFQ
ncbi:hypothetical protein HMPREF0345_0670 [Enterococcus faecalis ATCC 29200]|nr:Hypothetical protein DENG_00537 [Enterococcus faecalis DENG1]EEN72420.1 hypothetical protein HMPREF0345_0670 [Enterococcus faecalis ATCC 29200]EEN74525.1 hypothetical protein HMPREF0349_1568 [Enterococcus faecalis TX1322]EFM68712.1 hypothetical protein HMPREF9509_00009 [Enterococcus faecalis TX0411]EFT41171.1 hypothetical protein HMPREF9496_01848 [Enterococcus faecalis TX4000]EFT47428.1 hypothetical protein HMPREF9501_01702 [Enterococcus faecalis TX0027]EFU03811.1 hypothetical protein HMPR